MLNGRDHARRALRLGKQLEANRDAPVAQVVFALLGAAAEIELLRRCVVDADRCPAIERESQGNVACEELRPDVKWHRVADIAWPWHPEGRPLIDVATPAEVPRAA